MANVLLLGLDMAVASKIETVAHEANHTVVTAPSKSSPDFMKVDLVFTNGDDRSHLSLLRGMSKEGVGIRAGAGPGIRAGAGIAPKVIVVSRLAEPSDWIDAIEAGAADYCSSASDLTQLRWILESALARPKTAAA